MNRLKSILFVTVLALIGATAGVLAHAKSSQKMGLPGVKTQPLENSHNLEILLPEDVSGYQSKWLPEAAIVTNTLPPDTSFGQRLYTADDGFQFLANVVLMGSSRGSIHEPQVCLTAQGWKINDSISHVEQLHMDQPVPYDLPVMRLYCVREAELNGQKVTQQGVYVYWFVDGDRYTATHASRNMWSANDMVFKNMLDRWAYISIFTICAPGQEDATFGRIKQLINASVPKFQLVPQAAK